MSGLSGSGKTWIASRLAPPLEAVHLRSDVERKRLAGIRERDRSGSGIEQGLYSPEASARVYEYLRQCARDVLAGGYSAIVYATFHRRADRADFAELAAQLGVPAYMVHCQAPQQVLETRITERNRRNADASEADLSVLRWQETNFEAIHPTEPFTVIHSTAADPEAPIRVLGSGIAN
jgi:predicted kinase